MSQNYMCHQKELILLMIVLTNSITMVTELNAGSLVKLLLPYAQDFLSRIRSTRNLRHCGNNSLTISQHFA